MKERGFIINVKDRRDRRAFSRYGHGLSLTLAVLTASSHQYHMCTVK